MPRIAAPVIFLVCLGLVAGCDVFGSDSESSDETEQKGISGIADAPWPRFGYDLRSTSRSPNAGPSTGAVAWTTQTKAPTNRVADISIDSDGTIYAGAHDEENNSSDDFHLYAFNPDGSIKWTYDAMVPDADEQADILSVTIGDNKRLYATSNSDHLHAISTDGSREWTKRIQTQRGPTRGPIRTSDGTIYAGNKKERFFSIGPGGTDGWVLNTGGRTVAPALSSDSTLYVSSGITGFEGIGPGTVYAVALDGLVKWRVETEGRARGDPTVGPDGTVYVGMRTGRLHAFNPDDGTVKWRYETDGRLESSPAIGSDGTIYVGSYDDYFYAINPDGSLKWRYQTGGGIMSSPAIGGQGRIYVGSTDGTVYAFSPQGDVAWTVETDNPVRSSPAIGANGRLYIGSGTTLYAIGE